ncbi:MAG: MFS transporter [Nocardioidaceae bacterium]
MGAVDVPGQVQHRRLTALTTGFAFVIPCAMVLAGTLLGGRLATRSGLRATLLSGLAIGAAGLVAFTAIVGPATGWVTVFVFIAVFSLGQGIVFTAMFATATTGTRDAEQGVASGIATSGQQIGGAVGLAALVSIATTAHAAAPGNSDAITLGMTGITVLVLAALAVAATVPRNQPVHPS